jgi:hypothetical protein
MPALTETGVDLALSDRRAQVEHSYCRSELAAVNCYCFAARTSDFLNESTAPQLRKGEYVNRQALARSQAARRCQVYG